MKKILLLPAFEGTDQAAMRRANELAVAAGAHVDVYRPVYEPHLEGYFGNTAIYAPLRKRIEQEQQERLDVLAQSLREHGLAASARAAWAHPFHEAVAAELEARGADVLIMAPSEPSGALSHEDWRLVSACPAPVLVVNSEGGQRYKHVLAAVDPQREHGKPPELDLAILRMAKEIRDLARAQLRVVHCFTPLTEFVAQGLDELPVGAAEQALESAQRDALLALLEQAAIDPAEGELLRGKPEDVLLGEAERDRADLFVLGSVSRARLRQFFIGSTAERLLRRTKTDALIVKPSAIGASRTPRI